MVQREGSFSILATSLNPVRLDDYRLALRFTRVLVSIVCYLFLNKELPMLILRMCLMGQVQPPTPQLSIFAIQLIPFCCQFCQVRFLLLGMATVIFQKKVDGKDHTTPTICNRSE